MKKGNIKNRSKPLLVSGLMVLMVSFVTLIPTLGFGNETNLVGRWQFDEGTGNVAADTSGKENNGMIIEPVWINGKIGKALQFNGTSYVEIPHNAVLSLRSAITIEAWINPANNIQWQKIISKSLGGNTDYSFFQGNENNIAFSIKMGSIARTVYAPANTLPLGEWTYVVGTYDGGRMRIYINGVQVNSIAVSGEINWHAEPLRIGGEAGAYFKGQIDEVSIYNAALSAAVIRGRYEAANQALAPAVIEAATTNEGRQVLITFDKEMAALPAAPAGFAVTVDGADNPVQAVELNTNNTVVELTLCNVIYTDAANIELAYTAGTVQAADGGVLADFSDVPVTNNSTVNATFLSGRWQFNEGAGTTVADTSGNNLNGTLNGATWINGKVGSALSFDGVNDYVEIPHNVLLDLKDAMTIEAWINPAGSVGGQKILSKSPYPNNDYGMTRETNNRVKVSMKIAGVVQSAYSPANAAPAGEWTHVVCTYDGARMRLYINGTQVNSFPVCGQIGVHAQPLMIGTNGTSEYFQGMVDEVSIYNKALTAAQIQERYESFCETNTDAIITPTAATFNKFNPGDVTVTLELNGKSLIGLKKGDTQLIKGTDYTVSGNMVTINQAYLTQQPIGTTNITFDFSAGNDPVLAITIVDISTPEGPILLEAATTTDGTKVLLTFDRAMMPLPTTPAGFAVTVDGVDTVIQAVSLNTDTAIVEITLNEAVNCNNDLEISYTAGVVTAQDGTVLASFTPIIVTNNSTIRPPAPEQNMFYNNLNQLTEISFPSGKVAKYTYDLNGNLIRLEIID